MAIPYDERKAKALLTSRGYVVVSPRVVSKDDVNNTEVQRVVAIIGSRAKIAEALGISRMAVHAWDKTGKIPPRRATQIAEWAAENAPDQVDMIVAALDPDSRD